MAKHKALTVATNVKVYFCDPQSPWQLRHQRKHELVAATVLH
jgi:IS30 family transposase